MKSTVPLIPQPQYLSFTLPTSPDSRHFPISQLLFYSACQYQAVLGPILPALVRTEGTGQYNAALSPIGRQSGRAGQPSRDWLSRLYCTFPPPHLCAARVGIVVFRMFSACWFSNDSGFVLSSYSCGRCL